MEEKLGKDEALTITTASTSTDIRGTIVFAQDQAQGDGGRATTLGVLEGSAQVSYRGLDGKPEAVSAGQKSMVAYQDRDETAWIKDIAESQLAKDDLTGFVREVIEENQELNERIRNASDILDATIPEGGTVTFVARSASKLYDGKPLTRTSDVLVDGLPDGYRADFSVEGSQTNAGISENRIEVSAIFDPTGKDVTDQFAVIEASGVLLVERAPITVWTGSSQKLFDGLPLKNSQALLLTQGQELNPSSDGTTTPAWMNSAYEVDGAQGQKELYGLCGTTIIHATNPLTGETREAALQAGQKLTISLSDQANVTSIVFTFSDVSDSDLPVPVLRVFAANPDLRHQAFKETNRWDTMTIQERIGQVSGEAPDWTTDAQSNQTLLHDSVYALVNVDSDVTDYNGRPLGHDEVAFYPQTIDESITVTATGSQTTVGSSENTYTIDWGKSSSDNYEITEQLGTLTVTSASTPQPQPRPNPNPEPIPEPTPDPITTPVTFTAASARKTYDGTALEANSVTAKGLPEGYTYRAVCTGSQTAAGSSKNGITLYAILDPSGKDVTRAFTNVTIESGTLTVDALKLDVHWSAGDPKTYDSYSYTASVGGPCVLTYKNGSHAGESVTGVCDEEGTTFAFDLFTKDRVTAIASGEGRDVGTHDVSLDVRVTKGKSANYAISWSADPIVIEPKKLIVATSSKQKLYDGTPLTADVTVYIESEGTRYPVSSDGEFALGQDTMQFSGTSITKAGESASAMYTVDWGSVNKKNYTLVDELGTLTIGYIKITAGSKSQAYNGSPLVCSDYTVSCVPDGSMPAGWQVTNVVVTGSQTNVGSSPNKVTSYKLINDAGQDVTSQYPGAVVCVDGTLTVTGGGGPSAEGDAQVVLSRTMMTIEFIKLNEKYPLKCSYEEARSLLANLLSQSLDEPSIKEQFIARGWI